VTAPAPQHGDRRAQRDAYHAELESMIEACDRRGLSFPQEMRRLIRVWFRVREQREGRTR
jgi:hypothetical protein